LDRTNELEEQVQRLTGEVDDMRARMARLESGEPAHHNGTEPKSRRGFLKFGAGAVMGALGVAAAKVLPAAAATGGNFILGNPNAAGVTTGLTGDNTVDATLGPNPTLKVQALNLSGSKLATALGSSTLHGAVQALGGDAIVGPPPIAFEGIDAFASGSTAWGVYGLTDAGTGVVGESNTGIGLYARRSGRIRQEGLALAGAPTYGWQLAAGQLAAHRRSRRLGQPVQAFPAGRHAQWDRPRDRSGGGRQHQGLHSRALRHWRVVDPSRRDRRRGQPHRGGVERERLAHHLPGRSHL
jgi:hypothetical protein